jgi:hypothetical protein
MRDQEPVVVAPSKHRAGRKAPWTGLVVAILVVIGLSYGLSRSRTVDPAVSTARTPATTMGQAPTQILPGNASNQPSPQGSTGPIDTGTGGAPAASPQGETPGNMQVIPPGASDPTTTPR